MTFQEFTAKWFAHTNPQTIAYIMSVLDVLYLEFTPADTLELVSHYLNHADEIVNTLPEDLKANIVVLFEQMKKN